MATATTETRHSRPLPGSIRRGLGRLKRRLRATGAMGGLGKAAVVLAVAAATAMTADVAFMIPTPVRWIIWGMWIATAAIAAILGVVRPLVRRLTWNDLAALAERGEPALGERLTSAVGLLRQPHGSPELIAALVDDANARAGLVDLTRTVTTRGALSWLAAGAVAAAATLLPAIVKPDPFAQIAKRFLCPWADIDRIARFAIEVTPGDKVVALGSDIILSATVRSRFGQAVPGDEAWLEWSGTDGKPNRVMMAAGPALSRDVQTFAVTLPRLTGSVTYRARVGGDASRPYLIRAVARPAVSSLSALVEPPPYTRRTAGPARDPARIEAWEDSRVTLTVEGSRSLERADVVWPWLGGPSTSTRGGGASRLVAFQPVDDGKHWSATVVAEASGPFLIKLNDEFGLENQPGAALRVVVRPDAPPTMALAAPDEFRETSPDDDLTIDVAARDDVAVTSAELHYTIERNQASNGPASGRVASPLEGLGTAVARGEAALGLRALGLKPGDVLRYRIRVADNRPAPRGPNITWSREHELRIIEHSESLRARQDTAQREALRARLEGIQKTAATNRQQVDQLRYRADEIRRGHGDWDETKANELARRETSAREVSEQLQLLARDLEEHPAFHPLARPARLVADVESQAAQSTLQTARRAADATRRKVELEHAGARLGTVSWKVDELKRKFDELARVDDDRRRLNALARREDDLAGRTLQATKVDDRADIDALAQEQDQLRRELDDVLKNSPALRAEVLAAQAREADALAARARALAELQGQEARRTADDKLRAAAVKALAEKERALETDARRLAVRLDEPLAQNGRGRLDAGALARAGDAIESGDLDQARDRATEAEAALNRLTRDVDDVRNDPKALARRLVQRQERLKNETVEAVRASRDHPPQTPEGKAALTDRLKPLFERQEAISRLAAAITAPPEQKDAARDAAQKTARARDDMRETRVRDVEGHQNDARDALNRLVDALPDANRRRDQVRQKLAEARSRHEEIARDLETHLRETAPKAGQPHDPVKSAALLAQRVSPLARREREIAEALRAIAPEARAVPQRDRAAHRALEFADALETLRQQAPTVVPRETRPEPRPVTDWRVVGPFASADKPPFATDAPVDLNRKHGDRKGRPASWQAVKPANERGAIDLEQQLSTRDKDTAAFGYAELKSPTARRARLLIGSNDTFTLWLNGKQVYDSQISRSWAPDHARIDVPLERGTNRILVKCGNTGGNWLYSVAVSADPAHENEGHAEALAHEGRDFEHLRDALPALQVAARSALDRFQHKLDGKAPAEEMAAILSAEEREVKSADERAPREDAGARAELAAGQRRIASALANLDAPDAPRAKVEAVVRAEEAARALAAPVKEYKPAAAHDAVVRAVAAADALARLLRDEPTPREQDHKRAEAQETPLDPRTPRDFDDPALGVTPTERTEAAALARRQRHIREELQAVLGDASAAQRALHDRAADLGREVAELGQRAIEISPRSQWPARAAADLLGHAAPETMDRAMVSLHRGRPGEALGAQRQATDQVEQAARLSEDLAAALRADRPAVGTDRTSDQFAAAQTAARAAGQLLAQARAPAQPAEPSASQTALAAAAAAMHQAAHGLRAGDRSARGPSRSGSPTMTAGDPRGMPADQGGPDLAGLKTAVRATGRSWGELPGHLRTEILQMSQGQYRDDYARLIELYFREIAADAGDQGARP